MCEQIIAQVYQNLHTSAPHICAMFPLLHSSPLVHRRKVHLKQQIPPLIRGVRCTPAWHPGAPLRSTCRSCAGPPQGGSGPEEAEAAAAGPPDPPPSRRDGEAQSRGAAPSGVPEPSPPRSRARRFFAARLWALPKDYGGRERSPVPGPQMIPCPGSLMAQSIPPAAGCFPITSPPLQVLSPPPLHHRPRGGRRCPSGGRPPRTSSPSSASPALADPRCACPNFTGCPPIALRAVLDEALAYRVFCASRIFRFVGRVRWNAVVVGFGLFCSNHTMCHIVN